MDGIYGHGLYDVPHGPPVHTAPPWPPAAYDGQAGHPALSAGGPGSLEAPCFSHSAPYGLFGVSAPGPFPGNPYCSPGTFQTFPGRFPHDLPSYVPGPVRDCLQLGGGAAETDDEDAAQRRQDARWLQRFSRSGQTRSSRRTPARPAPAFKEALYRAVHLIRQLQGLCETLENHTHDGAEWDRTYARADAVLRQLRDEAPGLRAEADIAARRRRLRLRARGLRLLQRRQAEEHRADREAAISAWRSKKIREVEEKKKEKELKLAADSVLCEVRKKQLDLKRMQDVLRSLQKLRTLRKEAASRRGISIEQQCDGQFSVRLEELRSVMKRRLVLYSAEEKALMVMLEGEQEGERQRESERRAKKEAEQQLQRRRAADCLLFGEEQPADFVLQPFIQYYTQAQHSLHALLQIRREWDVFLAAADHPNGSTVPAGWIFPAPPSDEVWASALQPPAASHCS